MNPQEFRLHAPAAVADYRIVFAVSVADADALWSAAAARLLRAPGVCAGDVNETIGPREDPSLADCIAALCEAAAPAGCVLEDLRVREAQ